jgi:hypothetical protein
MKTAGIPDRIDREGAATDRTLDRPRHIPAKNWQLAVAFVQEHAKSFPCYWPLWCETWKRFLRRVEDGARGDVFNRLFNEYEQAGGTGGPYGSAAGAVAGPPRAAETAALLSASSEPIGVERR